MPDGCAAPDDECARSAAAQAAPWIPLDPSPATVNDPTSVERNHKKMRRALFLLLGVAVVAGLTGCIQDQMCRRPGGQGTTCMMPGSCAAAPETCRACGPGARGAFAGCPGGGPFDPSRDPEALGMFNPGPPAGAVTYPYYTVRGPRDFLAGDIRPIGP